MNKTTLREMRPETGSFNIPLSVFNESLTPLETITVYLKDELLLNYKTIAELTGRDQRGIGITYKRAKKKGYLSPEKGKISFPTNNLQDRSLSPAEHLVAFLTYERKLTKAEIARQLGKDQRTIWTMLSRAEKKRTN